ncbi:MAG: CoA ester lyase, partial [Acidimicrobiia bacterium]
MTPRSFLYAPGDRPELFEKAMRSGADGVVLDLEDSVLPGEKTAALQHVVEFLSDHDSRSTDTELWVRVNNRSGLLEEELSALAGSEHLAGVSLPKVESPVDFDRLDQMLPDHVGVLGLVESASGVAAVLTIASHPRVRRLGLGEADLI